jgi:hypothetical protein
MKILILLVLLCTSFSLAIQAQPRGDAGATYGLNGPVRSFRTETATVVEKDGQTTEGPRVLKMSVEFNESGNRTDYGLYDDKGILVLRIVTKFNGHTRESVTYDGAGKVWSRQTQQYDSSGQAVGAATYNPYKSLQSKKLYTRNEQGQVIEWAEYAANGVVLDRTTNTYTPAGGLNIIEREIRDPNGVLRSREFHDIPHLHVEIILYKPDGAVLARTVRDGEQISQYAEDGTLKGTTSISDLSRPPNSVLVANSSGLQVGQSTDQIDSRGNWTKQTQWVTEPSGTKLVKVTYRTISYYDK